MHKEQNKDNRSNGINTIQPAETIAEVDQLLQGFEPIHHKEVLSKLLNELQPIDFVSLIRPETQELMNEHNKIIQAGKSGNKELHQELNQPKGKEETSRMLELELMLKPSRKSIKQKHYVVCIITELLKIAKNSNWNLCKCYDYVYIYNGAYWKQLSKDDLKYFLGEAAIKFGYPEMKRYTIYSKMNY